MDDQEWLTADEACGLLRIEWRSLLSLINQEVLVWNGLEGDRRKVTKASVERRMATRQRRGTPTRTRSPRKTYRYQRAVPDPTPQEIAERCREIRNEWTPLEERQRRNGSDERYSIPEVRTPQLD